MRPLLAMALATMALLPAACGKTSTAAAQVAPGPAYNITLESNEKFIAAYATQKDVHKTADGLLYRVITAGSGKSPKTVGDLVTVTYKGQLITGDVFDQTKPGQTASYPAGDLIPGWVEALSLMKEGDSWEIVVPAALGYGPDGAGNAIPPDQTLVFQMTLLKVEPATP